MTLPSATLLALPFQRARRPIGEIFRHGVASGDPTQDGVVLWTRLTSDEGEPRPVSWTVATDPDLSDVVASGTVAADSDADRTVHAEVDGLRPGSTYHYAFEALGERSPIARTRTLPPPGADHLRLAMVSCAKYAAGFFNGYGRIAERDDLDFVLHLGDYIYEVSNRPPASETVGPDIGRPYLPDNECVDLHDYRARYAHYHQDPDLMAMHHAHPVIGIVDDLEFADNVWREGSLEHRIERDGPWHERRAAAFRGALGMAPRPSSRSG